MIPAAYYRNLLTPEEQELYKAIVNGLLRYETAISFRHCRDEIATVRKVVHAIHRDHPELFYVDFWKFELLRATFLCPSQVRFRMLLDEKQTKAVARTLAARAAALQRVSDPAMDREQRYYMIIKNITNTTVYRDSGSNFWSHTAGGAALGGEAVCEGVAKLFLFLCQQNQLPCAFINGTLHGGRHAWNMVETKDGIRYVDVTMLLNGASRYGPFPAGLFKTEEQLCRAGYCRKESL